MPNEQAAAQDGWTPQPEVQEQPRDTAVQEVNYMWPPLNHADAFTPINVGPPPMVPTPTLNPFQGIPVLTAEEIVRHLTNNPRVNPVPTPAGPHAHLSAEEFERQFGGTQTTAHPVSLADQPWPVPTVEPGWVAGTQMANQASIKWKSRKFQPKEPSEFPSLGASEIEKQRHQEAPF